MSDSITDSGEAVPPKSPISMYGLLQSLGFAPDPGVMSAIDPTLVYDFGNLKVTATACMGRCFRNVVLVCGAFRDTRSMAMIEYELPAVVSSTEQGLAFLAYAIDNQFGSKGFEAKLTPQWLTEGRTLKAYLPWEMEVAKAKAEAARRPHCTVERDWLRLGLKTLGEKLEGQSSQGEVDFNFDGVFFSIGGPGPPLLLPATGEKPWPNSIRVRISKLTLLPRRIMSPHVAITIYPDSLKIDRVWIPRLPDPLPASSGDEN